MNKFTTAYLEAALWSSTTDDGEPLDDTFGITDLAPETIARAVKDCAAFEARIGADVNAIGDELTGHNFWLTRNGHGAGFWDRGLGDVGDRLTEIASRFGECDLYVGDDGKLYFA